MCRFFLGFGILTVIPVLLLASQASENITAAEDHASDDDKGFSWYRIGRELTNFGLGALDTQTGVLSDLKIGILDHISNSNINPFFIFDRFLNQTRSTIPIIANHGNFTLLQAALLCAVGAMAAGAGAIALEAFYFKTVNDQTLAYESQHGHYGVSSAYGAPAYGEPAQPAYGAPAQPAYGAPVQPAYGAPVQPAYGAPAQQRRNLNIPSKLVRSKPTLSAKRLKPQSLRRTQRRNQRKNQHGGPQPTPGPGRKRRKRQAYNYNYPVYPNPTVAPRSFSQYLASFLYNPFQSFQRQGANLPITQNNWGYSGQNQNPARSESATSWFNFHSPNLNRKKNMINRSFQRYT